MVKFGKIGSFGGRAVTSKRRTSEKVYSNFQESLMFAENLF
jgi:hypothetical protein